MRAPRWPLAKSRRGQPACRRRPTEPGQGDSPHASEGRKSEAEPPRGPSAMEPSPGWGHQAGREGREGRLAPKELDLLGPDVVANVARLRERLGDPPDLVVRQTGSAEAVLYLSTLTSTRELSEAVVKPLLQGACSGREVEPGNAVTIPRVRAVQRFEEACQALLDGEAVLLRQGHRGGWRVDVREYPKRQVAPPESEPGTRGPREAFVEDLDVNLSLVRRKLRTPHLRVERIVVGRLTRTSVAVLYLAQLARPEVVVHLRQRLQHLDVPGVLGVEYLAELIEDHPWSPFPGLASTERPDVVASYLLEGGVAILMDGTSFALAGPTTFISLMQSASDYYQRWSVGTFVRYLRWLGMLLAMVTPSVYVSLLTFHHELIPPRLLFTVVSGREGVPFPPVLEALAMELAFEILREAGLRMPRQIGPAFSIAGVLVIGDAAVRAGLVSPLMLVVVGLTAVASFAIPNEDLANAVRILRFPLLAASGFLGFFGVVALLMAVGAHLVGMHSLGLPFFSPLAPVRPRAWPDAMARAPFWSHLFRPWIRRDRDEPLPDLERGR